MSESMSEPEPKPEPLSYYKLLHMIADLCGGHKCDYELINRNKQQLIELTKQEKDAYIRESNEKFEKIKEKVLATSGCNELFILDRLIDEIMAYMTNTARFFNDQYFTTAFNECVNGDYSSINDDKIFGVKLYAKYCYNSTYNEIVFHERFCNESNIEKLCNEWIASLLKRRELTFNECNNNYCANLYV